MFAMATAGGNMGTASGTAPSKSTGKPGEVPCGLNATAAEQRTRAEFVTRQMGELAQRKQLPQVKKLFALLTDEGLTPTLYSYANLINAHVNSGDLSGARRAFLALRQAGHTPNVVVYTTLIKGHTVVGDVERAEQLLDAMTQEQPTPILPDVRAVNTFLRGCLRVGDVPRALCAYITYYSAAPGSMEPASGAFVNHRLTLEETA